jgi:two-component system sensor histidine kinase PilS (NtrC family)
MAVFDRRRSMVWLIAGRAIVITLLLGSGLLLEINAPGRVPIRPFYTLVGLTYALTVVYALGVRVANRVPWLVDVQLALDACIITAIIAVSGGVTSYFSLLYVLPIIAAASLQRGRSAMIMAVLATVLYSGTGLLQYQGGGLGELFGASTASLPSSRVALYTVAINVFAFLAVAALAGSLAENLRRTGARLERASQKIEDLQAFNQNIIDSLTSGLVTTDVNGRILTLNRAAEKILGFGSGKAIERDAGDVLQLPGEVRKALSNDLYGERTRRAEYFYHRADGEEIEVGMAAAHLLSPDGKAGFLITFQDVTEIKRLERDARVKGRLAAVGEMAAGMAHEIRNPLASMAGSIQVLRDELALRPEQAELLDIVLRESRRLNDTIRGFLSYARPQRATTERLDLRKTLGETAMLLRNSAEVHDGQSVDVSVPEEPVWFEADEGQIRQVLWNLATNGLRAMPAGGRLTLSVRSSGSARGFNKDSSPGAPPPSEVVIEVVDEGVGIPQRELDGIFQPFQGSFRPGSGLGLAIVHRIVSEYHGQIDVSSREGEGTRVTVRLGGGRTM